MTDEREEILVALSKLSVTLKMIEHRLELIEEAISKDKKKKAKK